MQNIKLTIAYDGTHFHGFQVQPNMRTVQGVLQETLERVVGHAVSVIGSGRTDAGVHARGQVVNFRTSVKIPEEKWPIALNVRLPDDLVVTEAEYVPEGFHARFCACGKVYRYQVDLGKSPDVFTRLFNYHYPYPLRIEPMIEAAKHLEGRHDFSSFCAANTPVENKVRLVHAIDLSVEGDRLAITCHGEGFLYNMVRIIAGTLLDVGRGRIAVDDIPAILQACDRKRAGLTAPAHGLTMWEVLYE